MGIFDIGAIDHMSCSMSSFQTPPTFVDIKIKLPTCATTHASHRGHVILPNGLILKHDLYVPAFIFNLISLSHLTRYDNICVFISENLLVLKD